MSKFTLAGIVSWLVGLLLLGFQSISTLMTVEGKWKQLNIVDVVDPQYLSWMDDISSEMIANAMNYIVNMPLFVVLFCLGTLFFIINAFFE